jgi:hypothetical protein
MNMYYIRFLPSDWQTLLTLGEKIGAIQLHYEQYDEVLDAEGNVVSRIGVGEPIISATQGGAWDYIGVIQQPTGQVTVVDGEEVYEMAPVADANGMAYLHANLITPIALGEAAQQMAGTDGEIAAALAHLGKFFLLDAQGNACAPTMPHRVFAGMNKE